MSQTAPDSGYRPFVLKAVAFFFRHPAAGPFMTIPLIIPYLLLPPRAIQFLLFTERTPETLRLARNIKTRIHIGP